MANILSMTQVYKKVTNGVTPVVTSGFSKNYAPLFNLSISLKKNSKKILYKSDHPLSTSFSMGWSLLYKIWNLFFNNHRSREGEI
jgi:hypothetical protein